MTAWADRSEQIDLLSKAWVTAQAGLADVVKNRKADAGQYSYTYADLRDALSTVRPIFGSHGLAITQTAEVTDNDVVVWTTILHESGQFVTTNPIRFPAGKTAQNAGSAITYGRRYALMAVCGLATEDDDGAAAAPREPKPRRDTAPKSIVARTGEEEQIRAILADLSASDSRLLRDEFRTQFGTTLSGLPIDDHPAALGWVTARALQITGESD